MNNTPDSCAIVVRSAGVSVICSETGIPAYPAMAMIPRVTPTPMIIPQNTPTPVRRLARATRTASNRRGAPPVSRITRMV